jgi:hypothetical protein
MCLSGEHIMLYVYNNQLNALFILSLLNRDASTVLGINSPLSGGKVYVTNGTDNMTVS